MWRVWRPWPRRRHCPPNSTNVKELRAEIARLTEQLEQANKAKIDLEVKLAQLRSRFARVDGLFDAVVDSVAELDNYIDDQQF